MTSSSPRQQQETVETRRLAPIIPLRSAPKENARTGRKPSKDKENLEMPLFYDKPIFRTRKYDLL